MGITSAMKHQSHLYTIFPLVIERPDTRRMPNSTQIQRSMETEQGCSEVGNVTQSGRCVKPAHLRSDNPGNEQESQNPTPPATQPARRPDRVRSGPDGTE